MEQRIAKEKLSSRKSLQKENHEDAKLSEQIAEVTVNVDTGDEQEIAESEYFDEEEIPIVTEKENKEAKRLVSLEDVMNMKNEDYKYQILAILVTYWNILDKSVVDHFRTNEKQVDKTTPHEQVTFFTLAMQLIDRQHNKFEKSFEDFVTIVKRSSGHYYETIVKPIARLLLKIAQTQRMSQVITFIFNKCRYLEINSSPLTNFQEFYKFNNKNIFPFSPKDKILFVS
jgi:hypothetical protein